MLHVVLGFLLVHACVAQQPGTEVTSLPGFTGKFPTMYSGFLNATIHHHMHYVFVKATNVDPTTAPVLIWLNGGPGCSSLGGLFFENGPLLLSQSKKTKKFKLTVNPKAWTTITNVLYLESPCSVGFSYVDAPWNKTHNYSDTATATQNYAAVKSFFNVFPSFKKNKLVVAGESYAGIFVPMLADYLANDTNMNFHGFMVGNGCLEKNCNPTPAAQAELLANHGLYPLWVAQVLRSCPAQPKWNSACYNDSMKAHDQIDYDEINSEIDPYNLERPNCGHVTVPTHNGSHTPSHGIPSPSSSITCPFWNDAAFYPYMNTPAVRAALHVSYPENPIPIFFPCNGRAMEWNSNEGTTFPIYKRIGQSGRLAWYYVGALDSVVPFPYSRPLFVKSELTPYKCDWWPWHYGSRKGPLGGFITGYEGGNVQYLTVRGAGHMVPMDAPDLSIYILEHFLRNETLYTDQGVWPWCPKPTFYHPGK